MHLSLKSMPFGFNKCKISFAITFLERTTENKEQKMIDEGQPYHMCRENKYRNVNHIKFMIANGIEK